jgi:hypothetical protein
MMNSKSTICLLNILTILLAFTGAAFSQFFVYDMDGEYIETETIDSLIAVRFDSNVFFDAVSFAYSKAYLKNDFDFYYLPERFVVFGIEQDWDFEQIAIQLRTDTSVFMVNPVCNSLDRPYYVDNQLVVCFEESTSLQAINDAMSVHGLTISDTASGIDTIYFAEFQGSTDLSIFEICNRLYEDGICLYAQPDFFYTSQFFAHMPQDPYFDQQWHLHNTGQSNGSPDADIDMPEA